MPDKRFHLYLSHDRINVCWVGSVSDTSLNYTKTFSFGDKEIIKLVEWMVVTTGFPKAKVLLEIEAPFNNHQDLIHSLEDYNLVITVE